MSTAPKLMPNSGAVAPGLETLTPEDFSVGIVKAGKHGDKFFELFQGQKNGMPRMRVGSIADPVFASFNCSVPTTAEGVKVGENYSLAVSLPDALADKFLGIEKKIRDALVPMRKDMYTKGSCKSDEEFVHKWKSRITPATMDEEDPSKVKYPPRMNIFVEHEAQDKDGKKKPLPLIQKTSITADGKLTKPIPGTIEDIKKGSALQVEVAVYRGGFAGQMGVGMKLTAAKVLIILNKSRTYKNEIDYTGYEFADEETVDTTAPAVASDNAVATTPQQDQTDDQFNGN